MRDADEVSEIVSTNFNKQDEKRPNDAVRKESLEKKQKFQENQGEKIKKRYTKTMKERASSISLGDVVTVWVDPRVDNCS